MTESTTRHRLVGLEPDSLLAFLALLGLLRSLEAADRERPVHLRFSPRACWDLDQPPLRPVLCLAHPVAQSAVTEAAAHGISILISAKVVGVRRDLDFSRTEARVILETEAKAATVTNSANADLVASLMCDAAVKDGKGSVDAVIDPTPLCLLFGQGHQHFLERLVKVPAEPVPPVRGKGKNAVSISETECLAEALFSRWHRGDPTPSFRWDPEEDVRYALMAGDPTDPAFKGGTQHGANRLASVGLATLTLAPRLRAGRVRSTVLGGSFDAEGFSFSWPIWREPASLSTVSALLGHPDLREPDGLAHLGVENVFSTRRISVGKFMNFTRAKPQSF
jgi:hypothetical protein